MLPRSATPRVQRALIAAGGQGRRLAPLTARCSKALLPIGDRLIIDHALHEALESGVTELAITVPRSFAVTTERCIENNPISSKFQRIKFITEDPDRQEWTELVLNYGSKQFGPILLILASEIFATPPSPLMAELHAQTGLAILLDTIPRPTAIFKVDMVVPNCAEAAGGVVSAGRYVLTPEIFHGQRRDRDFHARLSAVAASGRLLGLSTPSARWSVRTPVEYAVAHLELTLYTRNTKDAAEGLTGVANVSER